MWDISSVIMTIFSGAIGLLGLFLASRAVDTGFAIFGYALAVFAVLYIFTTLKRLYDQAESK